MGKYNFGTSGFSPLLLIALATFMHVYVVGIVVVSWLPMMIILERRERVGERQRGMRIFFVTISKQVWFKHEICS